MPPRSRSRAVAAALVAAAHLVLLLAWLQARVLGPGPVPAPRISVRLIAAAPPARAAEPAVAPPVRETLRRTVPATRGEAPRRDALPPLAITMPAIAPEPAASQTATATPAAEPLLDSEATRRALRASARDAGLAAQAGRIGSAPLSTDERLGAEVHKGAHGDCLKGEFLGAGMGLLSLPFLAVAALREQCRR